MQPVQFPSQGHPFVGPDGLITQPWMQFLLALWLRSGGSPGPTPDDSSILSLLMGGTPDETALAKTEDRAIAALLQSSQTATPQQNTTQPQFAVEGASPQDGRRYMQPFFQQEAQSRDLNGLAAQTQPQPIEDKTAFRNAFVMAFTPRTFEGDSSRNWSVKSITVGASPYSYKAPSNGFVAIDGGAVSLIEFSRDGTTFISVGTGFGAYPVRKNDFIRTTYSSTPTLSFVPM